jgi:protease-4
MGPLGPSLRQTIQAPRLALAPAMALLMVLSSGCHHPFPVAADVTGNVRADANVQAGLQGSIDVRMPQAVDPGPVLPVVVKEGGRGPHSSRVALIDVDGLLLNQNPTGLGSIGENPVAAFREKLEAAACDPRVTAVVIRINSSGGGVAATDLMAEELRRFRATTNKPTVACLLDVATSGAYYLAVGCNHVVALPSTVTGGIGTIVNHANLQGVMGYFSAKHDTVKSGDLIDMGDVTMELSDEVKGLFQEMSDAYRDRFTGRVTELRPAMSRNDRMAVFDGRVVPAQTALKQHMIDSIGYPEDAIAAAERLANGTGSEVVLFQRAGYPTRSIYATTPNIPIQSTFFPMSVPGIDRTKLPTFLYLWQPDPTVTKLGGQY